MTADRAKDPRSSITRRGFLKTGALAAAGAALPTACSRLPEFLGGPAKQPNIIFVFTDDHAFDAIGYASGGRVKTPHLDRLAANGAIFNNAYCSAMTCVPSRTTVLGGRYYHRSDKSEEGGWIRALREGAWAWPRALQQAGYRTGFFGKGHFAPTWSNHGFDVMELSDMGWGKPMLREGEPTATQYMQFLKDNGIVDYYHNFGRFPEHLKHLEEALKKTFHFQAWCHPEKYHRISWIRDKSIGFIKDAKEHSGPFALMMSIPYPHAPYVPSKPYVDLYDPASIEVPTDEWLDMERMPEAYLEAEKTDFFDRNKYSKEVMQSYLAHNWGLISQIDAAVGKVLEHVDMKDTLVVFTGDHGDFQGRRGRLAKNPWIPFEQVAKVPLMVSGWGVPKGVRVDSPVELVDIAPTILRAAGIEAPESLDGTPLQNYFDDPSIGADRTIFCQGYFGADMVGHRNWRYIQGRNAPLLFDLSSDPDEYKNLAGLEEYADAEGDMQDRLDDILKK